MSPPGATTTTAPGLAGEEDVAVGCHRRREVRPRRARQAPLLDHRAGLGVQRGDDAVVVDHVEHAAIEQRRGQLRHACADTSSGSPCRSCRRSRRGGSPACRSPSRAPRGNRPTRPSRARRWRRGRRRRTRTPAVYFGNSVLEMRAVAIGIGGLPHLVGGRNRHLVARVVDRRAVAVDVDGVAANHRRRLHLERQAAHPPQLLAGRGVVRRQQERTRQQDLILAIRTPPQDGGGVAAASLRADRPSIAPCRCACRRAITYEPRL